jgi:hypothetical protein
MDNAYEGLYLDDFIIGFAERGEMVVGATANANFTANAELFNNQLPVGLVPHNEIHVGPYQLEIRQGETYGLRVSGRSAVHPGGTSFRHQRPPGGQVSFDVPAGSRSRRGANVHLERWHTHGNLRVRRSADQQRRPSREHPDRILHLRQQHRHGARVSATPSTARPCSPRSASPPHWRMAR